MSSAAEKTQAFYGRALRYGDVARPIYNDSGKVTQFELDVLIYNVTYEDIYCVETRVRKLFVGQFVDFTRGLSSGVQDDGQHVWTTREWRPEIRWISLFGFALFASFLGAVIKTKNPVYLPLTLIGVALPIGATTLGRRQIIVRDVHPANCELPARAKQT
jgi:hypothetical protein